MQAKFDRFSLDIYDNSVRTQLLLPYTTLILSRTIELNGSMIDRWSRTQCVSHCSYYELRLLGTLLIRWAF